MSSIQWQPWVNLVPKSWETRISHTGAQFQVRSQSDVRHYCYSTFPFPLFMSRPFLTCLALIFTDRSASCNNICLAPTILSLSIKTHESASTNWFLWTSCFKSFQFKFYLSLIVFLHHFVFLLLYNHLCQFRFSLFLFQASSSISFSQFQALLSLFVNFPNKTRDIWSWHWASRFFKQSFVFRASLGVLVSSS